MTMAPRPAAHVARRNARRRVGVLVRWALSLASCASCADVVLAQPRYPNSYLRYAGDPDTRGDAASMAPPQLKEVTFRQRLNEPLPLDVSFTDESGHVVRLGEFFGKQRPVVLAFVYYRCPMLCTQVMNGISSAIKVLPFTPGREFDVVLISFDSRDTPATATEKKRAHLQYWSSESTAGAWHLLTGDDDAIRRATSAAGFNYRWDGATGQFAHVSGVLVVTPDGRLSRYFYGVEYSPKDLRMALVESGEGKIGSAIDELLLYCFHYDPESARYGVIVMNLIRLGGVVTLALMIGFILIMRRRDTHTAAEGRA